MQYASFFGSGGRPTWGAHTDGFLHDLGPSGSGVAPTLKDAVSSGVFASPVSLAGAPTQPEDGTTFLPLIHNPGKVVCIGVNYRSHREETGRVEATHPTVFLRFADTVAAHGQQIPIPAVCQMYDYEGEVAIVIGQHIHQATRDTAWSAVSGYALFNDLSARDWQRHTGQWTPGKNFPASGPFGPYFVPSSDMGDIDKVVLQTRVNGEIRQHALLADLIFDIPAIIEYVTAFTALAPGDVIVTGTPGGVGAFMEPPTFLAPGDVVEIEATGLGTLRNTLVADSRKG
ncbi:MAG: fumarylacetoacetate hydrolase family protein [Propionibacteriaceae bacterium]|nr:fumarylacetoacetate hydrolase family protein [Propionibacteriaceae bacterium]